MEEQEDVPSSLGGVPLREVDSHFGLSDVEVRCLPNWQWLRPTWDGRGVTDGGVPWECVRGRQVSDMFVMELDILGI